MLLVAVATVVAVLVVLDRRRPWSYRRLGLVPVVGVLLQAVIGGITVLVDLHPAIVGGHLLISMALVAFSDLAGRAHARGRRPGRAAGRPDHPASSSAC